MVDPGVGFAIVVNAALLALLAAIAYRYVAAAAGGDEDAAAEWYREGRALTREVQRAAAEQDTPAVQDSVQRDLLPLSSRLKGHARDAPAVVDDGLVRRVYDVGAQCWTIGMEHTTRAALRDGVFLEEKLRSVSEEAAALEAEFATRL